jgi:hypothetical protein
VDNLCSGCGAHAPETNTNYTLISSSGWRLTRSKEGGVAQWRCPACWRKYKEANATSGEPITTTRRTTVKR